MKFLFYKPLKIENDNILFWSDTHFNHKCEHWEIPLWKTRGFSSVEEHNDVLISRWNAVSNEDSCAFHLGDFIFGKDSELNFKDIVCNKLRFRQLYVMPGNHNSGWKQTFEQQPGNVWKIDKNKTVFFVPNYLEIYANGQPMVLSHYPIASFNGQARGCIHLHGHCHSKLANSDLGPFLYKTKTMDVGVESCDFPITLDTILKKFINTQSITYDHHTKDTLNPF